VKIFQGGNTDVLIGSFSGSTIPPAVVVPGNKAYVTFTTNGSVSKNGWYATYTSQSMPWCQNMTVFTDPQGSFDDGSFNFKL